MKEGLSKFVDKIVSKDSSYDDDFPDQFNEDYIELETGVKIGPKSKVIVKPFIVEDFVDIKPALDSLREGYTIALINIKPLKEKDMIELKRAVGKIRKTCEAIDGDVAGFGEDWLVATPSFAGIHREEKFEEELIE
tara:strand:- start:1182 stop:1589 length:408 start_codon:yes stop_codon:yes gene_type:complete